MAPMLRSATSTSADTIPSVDVVIVNWNGGPSVAKAARSAVEFGGRAIIVDNDSIDGSLDPLRGELGISIIEMGYNAGFARACNAGASFSDGDYIFLLNLMRRSLPDGRTTSLTPWRRSRALELSALESLIPMVCRSRP